MDQINFYLIFSGGIIALLVGFVWYNPKVFGTIWMKETGMTPDDGKNVNMAKLFGLTFLLGCMIGVAMYPLTIHQMGVFSVFEGNPEAKNPNSEIGLYLKDFMSKYGRNFRTFKHGAFHGVIASLFIALPIIGINSLFEKRSFKYVAIHVGYWMVTMALIGGVVCQWA